MAKHNAQTTHDVLGTIVADAIVESKGYKLRLGDMPADALVKLAGYGFKQWLADAIAGNAKMVRNTHAGRGTEVGDKAWAKITDGFDGELTVDQLIEAINNRDQDERYIAIANGTVGTREGGPRMTGIDKAMRDMATRELEAKAKALKMDLGSKEHKAGLVAQYMAKHSDRLRTKCEAEAAALAAIATAPVAGDDDLAKLMA